MTPQAGDTQLLDSLGLEGLLFLFCLLRAGCKTAYARGRGEKAAATLEE